MATKEFIEKRIEGKQKEISKLENKLIRIQKAKETNWEVNPYYYNENDLKWTTKYLEDAKKSLAEYQDNLKNALQKESSRNVPAITEFLDRWLERNVKYYTEQFALYQEALKNFHQEDKEYCNWWNTQRRNCTQEERKATDKKHEKYRNIFKAEWSHVTQFFHGSLSWEETMQKDMKDEYNRKYDFIIERTNEIVGQITDASNLKIGSKGDLNGFIIGTKGIAKVQTIGAGGYNIQCFHFRTLINEMQSDTH